jgi:hypothetical protein
MRAKVFCATVRVAQNDQDVSEVRLEFDQI